MPRGCSDNEVTCTVSRAIGVFQEKWVLHIVHALLEAPRGFNDLGREVGGCNPTTLTQRLARLEELGLVHRSADCGAGRSAYALTDAGAALRPVIEAIRAWSASHLAANGVAHGVAVEMPRADADAAQGDAVDAPPADAEPLSAPRVSLGAARIRAHGQDERMEPLSPLVAKPN